LIDAIDAELEPSWPPRLRDALANRANGIAAYHAKRAEIDRAAVDDVTLRINRPENPHQNAWDEALDIARTATAGRALLGFHATRLTPAEQAAIRTSGLRVLSKKRLYERIDEIEATGLLAAAHASQLRSRHQASDDNRSGMLWFSFTRAPLSDEASVARLFRSWGGEALYNGHETDQTLGPALMAIGAPCIITSAVPIDGLEVLMDVGERLLNEWCARRYIKTGHGSGFEGHTRKEIPAAAVKIIPFSDAQFSVLTGHREWQEPLS
jgi:hypothetical protein